MSSEHKVLSLILSLMILYMLKPRASLCGFLCRLHFAWSLPAVSKGTTVLARLGKTLSWSPTPGHR